jgi:hypothetical protein
MKCYIDPRDHICVMAWIYAAGMATAMVADNYAAAVACAALTIISMLGRVSMCESPKVSE